MTDAVADHRPGLHRPTTLSIILPVLNGAATIEEQLAAVNRQHVHGVALDLIVVDNGSTDATRAIVERFPAAVPRRVVEANREHNLAYARNVGVRAATGAAIAFCDADDVVGEGWAAGVVDGLSRHHLLGYAFEYTRLNAPGDLVGHSRHQSDQLGELFGRPVASGAMAMHTWVWQAVGGNDEHWDFTGEDYDFVLRVHRDLGLTPGFAADAVYHCRVRSTASGSFRQARRYGRAHVALYRRYVEHRPSIAARGADAARRWWWVLSRMPLAPVRRRRVLWARRAGMALGRIEGSIRERVLLP